MSKTKTYFRYHIIDISKKNRKSKIENRKSKITPLFFCTVLVLSCLTTISAQTTGKTITIDEAVRLGINYSQQLKVSNAKLDVAKAKREQYWSAQIPTVTASANYTRISDNITPFSVTFPGFSEPLVLNPQVINQYYFKLSAQQIVYAGGRANNFYKSSEFLEKAAQLDVSKDKLEIKNNIEAAVINLYKLQKSKLVLDENLKVMNGRLTDTKNFAANGTAIDNDVMRADLAVTQIQTSQQEINNLMETARFNLCLMLGLPTDTRLELDNNSIISDKNLAPLDTYLKASETRPDIAAQDLRKQATEKLVEVSKGAYLPLVSVGANLYDNRPNQRVFPPEDAFKSTWDLGVTVSYNISSLFTNKYQVNEAKANLAQAEAAKQQLTDGTKMEIGSAYFAYQTELEKIKLYEKTINQATENQRVMKNRYKSQISTIVELLDADALVINAQLNLENAKADAELAYRKLLKASGR